LSVAFLLILSGWHPRSTAFLLHDVFDNDYADIAHILEERDRLPADRASGTQSASGVIGHASRSMRPRARSFEHFSPPP
jgi:hypothetical protein